MRKAFFDAQMNALSGLKYRPTTTDGHWMMLEAVPETALAGAVRHFLATGDVFPSPAEILRHIDSQRPLQADEESPDRMTPVEPFEIPLPHGKPVQVRAEWRYDCDDCGDGLRRCGPSS